MRMDILNLLKNNDIISTNKYINKATYRRSSRDIRGQTPFVPTREFKIELRMNIIFISVDFPWSDEGYCINMNDIN